MASSSHHLNYYTVGYEDGEYNQKIILVHKELYSAPRFEDMVTEATCDVAHQVLKDFEAKYALMSDEDKADWDKEYDAGKEFYPRLTFRNYYEAIAVKLCEKFGFQQIDCAESVQVFAWADLFDTASWPNSSADKLREAVIESTGYDKFSRRDEKAYKAKKLIDECKAGGW